MNSARKRFFTRYLVVLLGFVLMYQNCGGDTEKLTPLIYDEVVDPALFRNFTDVCSEPALSSSDKVKLLFIVDMSASNVFDTPRQPYKGSDLNGKRFDAIRDFLQQDCLKASDASEVAVIGFADSKQPSSIFCDETRFVDFSSAEAQISQLEDIDGITKGHCAVSSATGNCSSFTTDYLAGIQCAQSIIYDDIAKPDEDGKKSFYMTFFLTDGEPRVSNLDLSLGSAQYNVYKNNNINVVTQTRNKAEEEALGMQFQPIFYGENYLRTSDPSGDKQKLADDILTKIAEAGLSEHVSLADVSQINLCDLMASGNKVPYRVKQFVVTNLTSVKIGDQLLADSDVDGIPDVWEQSRGFDPQTPRSMVPESHLMDGACGGLGKDLCVNSAFSDCGEPNATGLTRCEVAKLGLINGLDSEEEPDSFLDIMELVKGTALNDVVGVDDGDLKSEFEELMIGRDPNSPDDDTPDDQLVKFRRILLNEPLPGCPATQESIHFVVDQVPLVKTLATKYHDDDQVSFNVPWLEHGSNENIIFIYYILTPANQKFRDELKDQVFGQFIKVNYSNPFIGIGPFDKLGEIAPSFEESLVTP